MNYFYKNIMRKFLVLLILLLVVGCQALQTTRKSSRLRDSLVLLQGDNIKEWVYFPDFQKKFNGRNKDEGHFEAQQYVERFHDPIIVNNTSINVSKPYFHIHDGEENGYYDYSKIVIFYNIYVSIDTPSGDYSIEVIAKPKDGKEKEFKQIVSIRVEDKT